MKITIIGLGIIGGSYAKGLTMKGYEVYGVDRDLETIKYALENGFIKRGETSPQNLIPIADMVIIGLYPDAIIPFIKENINLFQPGQVVTDVCGVKTPICYEATELLRESLFVGSHPMAGREKVGIMYSDEKIFKGTNFLICPIEKTSKVAIDKVKEIAFALEFGKTYEITPEFHDEMIAYTSQLTHAIAVSLVNISNTEETKKFIGDSYRDLTRIAMINEKLWSELFLDNKNALINEIDTFQRELETIKTAISSGNLQLLEEKFISSRKKREVM